MPHVSGTISQALTTHYRVWHPDLLSRARRIARKSPQRRHAFTVSLDSRPAQARRESAPHAPPAAHPGENGDQGAPTAGATEPVVFLIRTAVYELNLSNGEVAAMRSALAPFLTAARRLNADSFERRRRHLERHGFPPVVARLSAGRRPDLGWDSQIASNNHALR